MEATKHKLFADAEVGKKNMAFGIALFLILGGLMGIPLTINFLEDLSFGRYASLDETVYIAIGITVCILGQVRGSAPAETQPRTQGYALR